MSQVGLADDYSDLDQMFGQLLKYEHDAQALLRSHDVISQYGLDPTSHAILTTTGLLSGTSMETLAMECLSFHKPQDAESQMAMESLMEKARETGAHWATKIVEFAKHAAHKFGQILGSVWDKMVHKTQQLSEVVWDKAKAAGRVIKAHPIKSILLAAGIAAGVATLVAHIRPSSVYTGETQLYEAYNRMKDGFASLASKFGKKTAEGVNPSTVILNTVYDTVSGSHKVEGTIESLGITKRAINVVFETIKSTYKSIRDTVVALGSHAHLLGEFAIHKAVSGVKHMSIDPRPVATKLMHMVNTGIKTVLEVFKAIYSLMTIVYGTMTLGG